MSSINSAALESIERSGLHYVTKQLESRMTLRQHRKLLVDAGWLFLLNPCVQYDRGSVKRRTSAKLPHSASVKRPATARSRHGHGRSRRGSPSLKTAGRTCLTQLRPDTSPTKRTPSACSCTPTRPAPPPAWETAASYAILWTPDAHASTGYHAPEHHFIIDPDKWDFYEMDAYRLIGDDERAATHARSVIRISTGPDGTEISPMRATEARLTLGVAAARTGETDEAIGMGATALEADRKSLPSLLSVADELDNELRSRHPRGAAARDFHEQVMLIKRGTTRTELPF
ncbi:hypothetical protein [Streptomyces sp. CB09001]|uniref:hypothetical protein n=1 Tax=Streptomyces sp. CB09001 TaxID=2083284 RepID=UPI001F077AB3|nr:hypothetical protein [Streptomyces sp. CB09001]